MQSAAEDKPDNRGNVVTPRRAGDPEDATMAERTLQDDAPAHRAARPQQIAPQAWKRYAPRASGRNQ